MLSTEFRNFAQTCIKGYNMIYRSLEGIPTWYIPFGMLSIVLKFQTQTHFLGGHFAQTLYKVSTIPYKHIPFDILSTELPLFGTKANSKNVIGGIKSPSGSTALQAYKSVS